MVRVLFDPTTVSLNEIVYPLQTGGYFFTGISRQRGAGVGDVLRSLWRFVLPAIKTVGKEGIAATASTLGNIYEGMTPKEAIKKNAVVSAKRLLQTATDSLEQSGKGVSCQKNRVKGRLVKTKLPQKTRKTDIFGKY
uniref:Senescence domain-containing protein n=1 Tax=Panagrolaimus davidi TaxID=227884 RepID=A0A914QSC8_9BILA